MRTHVWLLSAGCLRDPSQARPWLERWLADPRVTPYAWGWLRAIVAFLVAWKRAPLLLEDQRRAGGIDGVLARAEAQAALLQRTLGGRYAVRPVLEVGGASAAEAASAVASGEQVVLLPLFAPGSPATTGRGLELARAALHGKKVSIAAVGPYADDPAFVEALAECLREALMQVPPGQPYAVLFCGNAAPAALVDGPDAYGAQAAACAAAVAQAARLAVPHQLGFLSTLGPPAGQGPAATDLVAAAAGRGLRTLVVLPLCPSVEDVVTLGSIDGGLKDAALAAGLRHFLRAPAPGTRPTYLRALAERVRATERAAGWAVPEDAVRAAIAAGETA